MTDMERRGLCEEAEKIGANDVAAGIERVIGNDLSICQFKPRKSANGFSNLRPTNTLSTMLPEKPSNGTKIARSARSEPSLSAITGGNHVPMTGWLESQISMMQINFGESLERSCLTFEAGQPVDRGAPFSHSDGHFHTDSSTSAAEALTNLRQTAIQHIQLDIHGRMDETMEDALDALLGDY